MAFATGKAGNAPLISFDSPGADAFAAAVHDVCRQLAHLVVRDGEGASKFIAVTVTGAVSDESARRIGLAIANSPLVKTAIAGENANWGREIGRAPACTQAIMSTPYAVLCLKKKNSTH